jgi:hypothetical protein
MSGMSTSLILYQGEPVACTGGGRACLIRQLLLRPDDDPERRFVLAMCLFALEVAYGHRPGPYSNRAAEASARDRLLPSHLFAEVARCDDDNLAHAFAVPATQIRRRRRELGLTRASPTSAPGHGSRGNRRLRAPRR